MIKIRKNNDMITTWAELKDDIRDGSSLLNVGDEIDIELKTGEKVTLVCERVGHRSATFFTKNLLEDAHCMSVNWAAKYGEQLSTMEAYLGKLFRLLREKEVFGENKYGKEETCEPLLRYFKEENLVKMLNNVPFSYWLASPRANSDGSDHFASASLSFGVCFGFDI